MAEQPPQLPPLDPLLSGSVRRGSRMAERRTAERLQRTLRTPQGRTRLAQQGAQDPELRAALSKLRGRVRELKAAPSPVQGAMRESSFGDWGGSQTVDSRGFAVSMGRSSTAMGFRSSLGNSIDQFDQKLTGRVSVGVTKDNLEVSAEQTLAHEPTLCRITAAANPRPCCALPRPFLFAAHFSLALSSHRHVCLRSRFRTQSTAQTSSAHHGTSVNPAAKTSLNHGCWSDPLGSRRTVGHQGVRRVLACGLRRRSSTRGRVRRDCVRTIRCGIGSGHGCCQWAWRGTSGSSGSSGCLAMQAQVRAFVMRGMSW